MVTSSKPASAQVRTMRATNGRPSRSGSNAFGEPILVDSPAASTIGAIMAHASAAAARVRYNPPMPDVGLQLRCQRCGAQMDLRDPAADQPWTPQQFWVCPRCGRHFWTTYASAPGAKAATPLPPTPGATTPAPTAQAPAAS